MVATSTRSARSIAVCIRRFARRSRGTRQPRLPATDEFQLNWPCTFRGTVTMCTGKREREQ